jgi:hypothetical protein
MWGRFGVQRTAPEHEFMNEFRQCVSAGLLLAVLIVNAPAQTGPVSPTEVKRTSEGRILQPEIVAPAASDNLTPRPDRVERTLPPEIKDRVRQFETAREVFIGRQEQLRRQLEGAVSDKERDGIRQRMKENLDQWRDQARQFRDEARERARELQRELPGLKEALNEGTGGKPGGRPTRPGLD